MLFRSTGTNCLVRALRSVPAPGPDRLNQRVEKSQPLSAADAMSRKSSALVAVGSPSAVVTSS